MKLCDGQEVISVDYLGNGMPYLALRDVLTLPSLNNEGVAIDEVTSLIVGMLTHWTSCMRDAVTTASRNN